MTTTPVPTLKRSYNNGLGVVVEFGAQTFIIEYNARGRYAGRNAYVMPTNEPKPDVRCPYRSVPLAVRRFANAHLVINKRA